MALFGLLFRLFFQGSRFPHFFLGEGHCRCANVKVSLLFNAMWRSMNQSIPLFRRMEWGTSLGNLISPQKGVEVG